MSRSNVNVGFFRGRQACCRCWWCEWIAAQENILLFISVNEEATEWRLECAIARPGRLSELADRRKCWAGWIWLEIYYAHYFDKCDGRFLAIYSERLQEAGPLKHQGSFNVTLKGPWQYGSLTLPNLVHFLVSTNYVTGYTGLWGTNLIMNSHF